MTDDETREKRVPGAEEAEDDVEGHSRVPGQRVPGASEEGEDDVEGHMRIHGQRVPGQRVPGASDDADDQRVP